MILSYSKSDQKKIVFFVFFITLINYFDRSAVSFAIQPIEQSLSIDNTSFGLIAGAFGIGYFFMCFFGGILVDRYGAILTWAIAAGLWSLTTLGMAYGQGFWSLFFLRLILGLAEGIHFPALLKIMADYLDPHWRSKCISIGLLGVPVASLIGAPLLSTLIEIVGWRYMFVILAVPGIVWAIVWPLLFRYCQPSLTHQKTIFRSEEVWQVQAKSLKKISWTKLFSSRYFIGNCMNFFILGYIIFFALMWFPGYIEQIYKVNILKTGIFLVIPWLVGSCLLFFGGFVSDWIWKRTGSKRKSRVYPMMTGFFLAGICFLFTVFSTSLTESLILLSMGLGFAFMINAPIFSLNADLFKEHAGTAQGVMSTFFAFSGIVSPIATGWLSQHFGNFQTAIFLVSGLCFLAAGIALILQREAKRQSKL